MRRSILLVLCLVACAAAAKNWALLFTGANGFWNYSTHSNLCHAFHVLNNAGIPRERIVVIMYNDVANDPQNPWPGKLFNNYTHVDVLAGTPMDYTGKEISAELILAVLRGDKKKVKAKIGRVGKVIESGPEDNIFVAVSDHGGPGVLLMPDFVMMTAKDINDTLTEMYREKKYAKLVWYLESCESGSIFDHLSKDINIYALTASNATHNAEMNYCYMPGLPDVCIGGQFSTAWTESAEKVDMNKYTLKDHSRAIINAVNFSIPRLFGDLSITKLPVGDFLGEDSTFSPTPQEKPERRDTSDDQGHVPFSRMPQVMLQRRLDKAPENSDLKAELQLKMDHMESLMADIDAFFRRVARGVFPQALEGQLQAITETPSERILNWDCYQAALDAVSAVCNGMGSHHEVEGYALSRFSVLVNLCNRATQTKVVEKVQEAALVSKICQ